MQTLLSIQLILGDPHFRQKVLIRTEHWQELAPETAAMVGQTMQVLMESYKAFMKPAKNEHKDPSGAFACKIQVFTLKVQLFFQIMYSC